MNVPKVTIPEYDPELLELLVGEVPEELKELKASLRTFLKRSGKYYSLGTLASFLGTDTFTLQQLMSRTDYVGINTKRAQTILVLKPLSEATEDYRKYQAGLL